MPSPYAGFTTNLLNHVDLVIRNFTQNTYQAIVQAHQTEIYLALVLYIAFFGYLVLTGATEFTIWRAVRHLFVMSLVTSLATHWDIFAVFFNNVFTDGPAKLIAAITGGAYDPNAMLSDVFDKGILGANAINQNAGVWTLGFLIIGYTVFYTTLVVIGYALYLLILAKMALAVLLGLAPLFFMLLLFSSTKDFFSQYLRQVFNFTMIPVFTSAILSLMLKIVDDAITQLQTTLASHTGHGGPECVYVLLCLIVLWLLLHQVPGLANGVSGGLQLNHGNLTGLAAGILIGKAQIHATQAKERLGALSLKAAHHGRRAIGKAQSLFNRKKEDAPVGGL
jgi:type IV secretion system protein VirB6